MGLPAARQCFPSARGTPAPFESATGQPQESASRDPIKTIDGVHAMAHLGFMHLVWFHRVLIAAAIIFFAGFGISEILAFSADLAFRSLLLGSGSILAAAGLAAYLRRLNRILRLPN